MLELVLYTYLLLNQSILDLIKFHLEYHFNQFIDAWPKV